MKYISRASMINYAVFLISIIAIYSTQAMEVQNTEDVYTSAAMAAITHTSPKEGSIRMPQHDAYLYFCRVGHKEAVPALIKALSEVEYNEVEIEGKKERAYECTWSHLLKALKSQTRKDFGFDQAAWQKWWDTEGKNLPDSYFDPKKHGIGQDPLKND